MLLTDLDFVYGHSWAIGTNFVILCICLYFVSVFCFWLNSSGIVSRIRLFGLLTDGIGACVFGILGWKCSSTFGLIVCGRFICLGCLGSDCCSGSSSFWSLDGSLGFESSFCLRLKLMLKLDKLKASYCSELALSALRTMLSLLGRCSESNRIVGLGLEGCRLDALSNTLSSRCLTRWSFLQILHPVPHNLVTRCALLQASNFCMN